MLRLKQLQAIQIIKQQIETVSNDILAGVVEARQIEQSITGALARMENLTAEIKEKESKYVAVKCAIPSLEIEQSQGIRVARKTGQDSQAEDVSNDTLLFRCASNHTDAYHDSLVVSWAKQLDNSARNDDGESSQRPNGAGGDDAGRETTSSTPPAPISIPPSCLYSLFLRSSRQQLVSLYFQLGELQKMQARIDKQIQRSKAQRKEVVDKITALKKDKEDLMEELTMFGEETGIQIQGL